MLPRENRLKRKNDFDKVVQGGSYVSERFLILKFQSNGLNLTRAGFVVSRKVSRKAVLRNKIKRRLREALRGELSRLKNGFDLVFFAKSAIEEKEFSDIQSVVKRLLQKAQLYV